MSNQRIVGIVVLVVGIILLVVGINSSNSVVDQVSETFTGRFTDATTWYLIGGVAAAILGVLMLSVPWGRKRA
jgi:di/tricarboxylate transporter